MRLLSNHFRSK